jgi:O-antigen/teichoic acid export membrane protein
VTEAPEAARDRDTMSLHGLAHRGARNLAGAAAGAVLSLAVTWLVAHGTTPTVAGTFFAATSVFVICAALAELGSEVSLARFLPRNIARGRTDEALLCLRAAVATAAGAGVVAAVAVVAFRHQVADLVGPSGGTGVVVAVVVLGCAVPVLAAGNTLLSATRGLSTVRPTVVIDKVGRGSAQAVAVGAALAAGGGLVLLTVAWTIPFVLAAVAAGLWLTVLLRRLPRTDPVRRPRRDVLSEYARYTWPRAVAQLSQIVMQRADIVLVAALRSPAEAAVYTVATRFLVVGQLGVHAVGQVLAPQTSLLLGSGQRDAAIRMFRTATVWTIAFTWPLHLATLGTAALLLQFFGGPAYAGGETVVMVLAAAALVATACGPVDTMLLMTGRSGVSLANNLGGLLVMIALDLVLIPLLGILGAAVGWAAAIVVRNVLGVTQVRRQLGTPPFSREAAVVAATAVATVGVPPLLLHLTGHDRPATTLAVLTGGALVFALWAWREVLVPVLRGPGGSA